MKVGIIDTGVDKHHKRLLSCDITGVTLHQNKSNNISIIENEFQDEDGHGTGIASIIHRHCVTASLFAIKVSSFDENISEELLCEAISYAIENSNAELLNISMGICTETPSERLITLCELADKNGIIINASSYYFAEKSCFPAHLNSVLGVGSGLIRDKESFKFLKNSPTNILAKGGFQRVANKDNSFKFGSGTSLATAHFTGIVANALYENKTSKKELKIWLQNSSDTTILSFNRRRADDKIISSGVTENHKELLIKELFDDIKPRAKRLAIFPFEEKEIQSLVRFNNVLPYEISLAIGYPRAIKMNNVFSFLEESNILSTNKNLTLEEFESFDTLVVGYFLEQLLDQNLIFGYELVKKAISFDKNFIVWDDTVYKFIEKLIKQEYPNYKGKIYFNSINKKNTEKLYNLAPLPEVTSPVLCVIGTGSIQGKFTVQMTIKEILERVGYKTSYLATEPQGVLFNADYVFPFGYNPPIHINIGEWSKILQLTLQVLQKKHNPDIFLTGSQGGVIPKYPINIGINGSQLKQLAFIQGIYPDAIICTISPHDSVDFIQKTITVISSYVACKVVFYALTPYTYKSTKGVIDKHTLTKLDTKNYEEKRSYFQRELNTPVMDILNPDNESLILELIQNTFV